MINKTKSKIWRIIYPDGTESITRDIKNEYIFKQGYAQAKQDFLKMIDKTLNIVWSKDKKKLDEYAMGHRAGWNDCIEYLDEEIKSHLVKEEIK